ncbi:hypothetical protein T03_5752 [Trichinella britovi]|uniref:Uncharacterized protein n=1 Tax=Trichinella britovi TaxID=45882 RepID=A0A0V1C4Q7_TRIBR|nr:hypothetical protein T03_5752 [Trichinella britovi]
MLGAEMEVRVEEGGEGVLSISVLLGRKSSDVSLCGSVNLTNDSLFGCITASKLPVKCIHDSFHINSVISTPMKKEIKPQKDN